MSNLNEWLSEIGVAQSAVKLIDVDNSVYHNKKNICAENGVTLFSDEWEKRQTQCQNYLKSKLGIKANTVFARKCQVEEVAADIARSFIEQYHIQGANKLGLVFFGLYYGIELIGVMSLGRHHRKIDNTIVLDRLCFKDGFHIPGGASRLFKQCINWANKYKYDAIISWSDNRLSDGNVYKSLGFTFEKELYQDYSYVSLNDPGLRISKQSQKKSNTKCPEGITEHEWAAANGLVRIWDNGKKRWIYKLKDSETLSVREVMSRNCARQHAEGVFKHSHIRGYFKSAKNNDEIYYSSSYELRCLYMLENNPDIISFKRCEVIQINDRFRNPDIYVVHKDGGPGIIEVKPQAMLDKEAVQSQIEDSSIYCIENDLSFDVWTEADSGFKSEKDIINWARNFIATEYGDNSFISRKRERNNKKAKRHYDKCIKTNKVKVYCEYCKVEHEPLKQTYDKAIIKNGRYICEREGGSIAGKKPKKKKENPYASEGKKQCLKCSDIKFYEEFSTDPSRDDGYCTNCKVCRKIQAQARYNAKKSN